MDPDFSKNFVEKELGPWSSHPASLKKQRTLVLFLGILPLLAVVVLCVLVYEDLFAWDRFMKQARLLTCTAFFSLGFLITSSMLYLVCFTGSGLKGKINDRDVLIFPPWLLLVLLFFWVLPCALSALPEMSFLEKLAQRHPSWTFLNFDFGLKLKNARALLVMLAFSPFLCVLTWILCAGAGEPGENEKLVRRPVMLVSALVCAGLLCASFFFPARFRFRTWVFALPLFLVFLTLWWFWRKKIVQSGEQPAGEGAEEPAAEGEPTPPEQAEYIAEKLRAAFPSDGDGHAGIRYEGVETQSPPEYSKYAEDASPTLIRLMNGKTPTVDQKTFLDRFDRLYEDALKFCFADGESGESGGSDDAELGSPDLILQGADGSGRTEALCAAALHAVFERGQNVLYIVPDSSYAQSLAEKMNSRFRELLVDCYYTADYLKPNCTDSWLPEGGKDKEGESKPAPASPAEAELPPNILFATPKRVEAAFFSNAARDAAMEPLRKVLLGYAVVLVDDFFEMPFPVRSHLAFILDKIRLLQASEYVMGQVVIATVPLQNPYGVGNLARRLFGLGRFSLEENAVMLRPRKCKPFWCGTLWVSPDFRQEGPASAGGGEQPLENAARFLLGICAEKKYNVLFYSREISPEDARKMERDYKEKGGNISVGSRLYQLDVEKMPFDTIFYLSLTSGNAAAALRLSLPDENAGKPVFFRIALEDEPERAVMDRQFALLPDESAFSLRAFHLRSVLPFLRPATPISAEVWRHFGISTDCRFIRNAKVAIPSGRKPVNWIYDDYEEESRYGGSTIWPFLVLDSKASISNMGQDIDFNLLPNTRDSIYLIPPGPGSEQETLSFVSGKEDSESASQIAVWCDRGVPILKGKGRTDLAHSDQLVLITPKSHFSVGQFLDRKKDAGCAVRIDSKLRRGLSYDIPIRRFSWNLPEEGFQVSDMMCRKNDTASFSISFGDSFTGRVSAEISGLMNPLGSAYSTEPIQKYAYDAFMSCLVFLPEENCKAAVVGRSLSGMWSTEATSGFSSPLTHAFSLALRNRMAGLSFFAMTPVFLIEGRDESFGRLLLWLLEPYNSGSTVYPLLAKTLFPDMSLRFKEGLLEDVRNILEPGDGGYVTLQELRSRSQLAFAGEDTLSPEEWKNEIDRGLYVIKVLLRDADSLERDKANREERRKKQEEERKKRQEGIIDPKNLSEEDEKERREFDAEVTAALMKFANVIDVSRFCRDYGWSSAKVVETFNDFLWNSPEIFFVAKSHHSQYVPEPDGSISSFFITNLHYDHEVLEKGYPAAKRELERAAAQVVDPLKTESDPVKKALKLHDHIVDICHYDRVACDTKDPSPRARTAYSVLVRKSHSAVCEGYTMAYRYLLDLVGIKSEEVVSDGMNHCWNYLNLNGNRYHVDVTWDDPIYTDGSEVNNGTITHDFFLLSDEKIRCKEHYGWSVRGLPPATDTKFDDMDWSSY